MRCFLQQALPRIRLDRLETCVLLVLATAIGYQLFIEPIVGVADNRDSARLIDPSGLDYESVAIYRQAVFQFVETKFKVVEPTSNRYLTTERPILGLAKLVNRLVSKDGRFDIRSLGLCHLVLYAGAILVFLRSFRGMSNARRLFVAGFTLLICTDVRLIAYFNSFYCESASLIFLFSTVGFGLLLIGCLHEGPAAWLLWFCYMSSAFLFWMAKSQNTAFAPALALGAWFLFPSSTLRGHRYLRLLGSLLIPLCVAWAFLVGAYGATVAANASAVVDEEILPHSPQPAADRQELLPQRAAAPSLWTVARFYAHHPSRWWQMTRRQAREAFTYPMLGNFTRASGLGFTQSHAFDLWSSFKTRHYPRNPGLLFLLLVLYCALALAKARWLDDESAARMRTLAGPILALGCALEFVATVTFEANGTAKHLLLFDVAVDVVLLMAVASLWDAVARLLCSSKTHATVGRPQQPNA